MILEMTHEEEQALRALLDRDLSNLYAEISHTDNPAFRAGLRSERDLLRAIRSRLDVDSEPTTVDA